MQRKSSPMQGKSKSSLMQGKSSRMKGKSFTFSVHHMGSVYNGATHTGLFLARISALCAK
jgi:hypothetical protein